MGDQTIDVIEMEHPSGNTRKKNMPRGEPKTHQEPGPASLSDTTAPKRSKPTLDADTSGNDIEVNVVQGGERRGWLRSNDRTMILALTFQHLSPEEKRRWLSVLRGSQTDAGEIDLALKYDDCSVVLGKKRGQYPERVRLVKFESSIKHDSDVVLLWDNALTLVSQNGVLSLKQDSVVTDLSEFFKVSDDRGKICVKFKLTTNITSKSHENRSFRFTAEARRGSSVDSLGKELTGESFDFELVAKHRSETKAKNVTKSAPVARAPPRSPPLPPTPVPQLILKDVSTDGLPGDLVT